MELLTAPAIHAYTEKWRKFTKQPFIALCIIILVLIGFVLSQKNVTVTSPDAAVSIQTNTPNVTIQALDQSPSKPSVLFRNLAVVDITSKKGASTDKPTKLTITLDPNKLGGVVKDTVRLYWWHEMTDSKNPDFHGYWDQVPDTTYDLARNRIEVTLTHFSIYAVRAPVEGVLTPQQKKELEKDLKEMLKVARDDPDAVGISVDIEETLVTVRSDGTIEFPFAPIEKRIEKITETKIGGTSDISESSVSLNESGSVQTEESREYYAIHGCHADGNDGQRIQIKKFDLERSQTQGDSSTSQEYVIKIAVHTKYDNGQQATLAGAVTEKGSNKPIGSAKVSALNQKTGKTAFTFTKIDGAYTFNVQSGLYTLSAGRDGCGGASRKNNLVCAHGEWNEDETLYYGGKTKGYTSNYVLDCSHKPPKITSFTYTQLHKDYEESPHRYLLNVVATDPENQKLKYTWQINCGYFVIDPTYKSQFANFDKQRLAVGPLSTVEWRYDTPGECENAAVMVVAHNEVFKEDVLKRSVF